MKKVICIICMMILIVGCQSETQKPNEVVANNSTEQIIEKEDKEVQTDDKKVESSKKQDKEEKKDDEVKKTEKESKPNTSSASQKDKTISREEKSDKPNTTSSSSTKPTNQTDKSDQTENDNKKLTQPPKPSTDVDDKKEEKPHQHMFAVNGGWFQTQAQAETRFDEELKKWDEKLENKEITWEEYGQKCPCGYEVFRCTCGMHGLNYSYR